MTSRFNGFKRVRRTTPSTIMHGADGDSGTTPRLAFGSSQVGGTGSIPEIDCGFDSESEDPVAEIRDLVELSPSDSNGTSTSEEFNMAADPLYLMSEPECLNYAVSTLQMPEFLHDVEEIASFGDDMLEYNPEANLRCRNLSALRDFPEGCGREVRQANQISDSQDEEIEDPVAEIRDLVEPSPSDSTGTSTSDEFNMAADPLYLKIEPECLNYVVSTLKLPEFLHDVEEPPSFEDDVLEYNTKANLRRRNVSAVRDFPDGCGREVRQVSDDQDEKIEEPEYNPRVYPSCRNLSAVRDFPEGCEREVRQGGEEQIQMGMNNYDELPEVESQGSCCIGTHQRDPDEPVECDASSGTDDGKSMDNTPPRRNIVQGLMASSYYRSKENRRGMSTRKRKNQC